MGKSTRRTLLSSLALGGLAGCLRLQDGSATSTAAGTERETATDTATATGTDTATATGTDTAADQPETTTEEPPLDYPSGLSEDGVEPYLVDVHGTALRRTTFTSEWHWVDQTEGDTDEAFRFRVGDENTVGLWLDGSGIESVVTPEGTYWREVVAGTPTYGLDRMTFDMHDIGHADVVRAHLASPGWSAPTEGEDRTFELTADSIADPRPLGDHYDVDSFESFEAEMTVSEQGIITSLSSLSSFVDPEEDRFRSFAYDYRITDIGSTTAATPDWLPTAKERVPTVEARFVDDRRAIEFSHLDGNPILRDSTIEINSREEDVEHAGRTEQPIEAGDTVYIYVTGDHEVRTSFGTRPTTSDRIALEGRWGLWMDRANSGGEYFQSVELG
ncbi:hypothetical protein [Haloarchaeobius sp. DT45]|uniref:hypothetical protein n=1 Tax=Haloarchaeobius sp. DT45 TaxID=3446116 RepID=UPI003F6B8679